MSDHKSAQSSEVPQGRTGRISKTASGSKSEQAKSLTHSWRPPVVVPFEDVHYQTFMEGMKTEGTFYGNRMATAGDDVKQLEYTIEYKFTPEKRYPGRKPNEPAMMSVHLRARVTDLANSNPEVK